MAVEGLAGGSGRGVRFLVSAGVVYEIMAAAASSPQTTEINAGARAETLMKWVHLGLAQSALFVGLACYFDPGGAPEYLSGAVLAAIVMEASYLHARAAGLKNGGQGTERDLSQTWGGAVAA